MKESRKKKKKAQYTAGFEPATSRLCSVCSTTVLQLRPKSPKSCFANRCSFVCRRLGHHLRGPDQVRVGPLLGHFRSLLHGSALRPLQVKPMPLPVAETCWAGAVIFLQKYPVQQEVERWNEPNFFEPKVNLSFQSRARALDFYHRAHWAEFCSSKKPAFEVFSQYIHILFTHHSVKALRVL